VWVENVAVELGLNPELSASVLPSIFAGTAAPPTDGINYALGGSLSSDVNVGGPPLIGLQQQIEAFSALAQLGAPPSENALHILLAGGNDYNEAILTASSAADLAGLPDQVTDNIVGATSALLSAGAKNIFVSNLPMLEVQPFADSVDVFNPQGSSILAALSSEHNLLLAQKLTALESTLDPSEVTLTQFDLSSFVSQVVADPAAFGLENAEDSCLIDFQIDNTFSGVCPNPDAFFFWDDVHPTAAGHALVAQAALDALADSGPTAPAPGGGDPVGVPEPSGAVAVLALGGVLGLSTRKRV
ncbi:MAG: SGNH/GDSL hydrolase family protein, partial [Cyanobacteria bacterium J06632_3]